MRTFLDGLDTPGGHMLVCFLVILLGASFHALSIPKSDDLIIGGSSVLFMAMRSRRKEENGEAR